MKNVEVQITAQGNELILREGEAPKVFNEKGYDVKTTMSGVKDYFAKRNIAQRVQDSYLVCSYEVNQVMLVINDNYPDLTTTITGMFSEDEDAVQLGINNAEKSYSFEELEKSLRKRAHLFRSIEEYRAVTASLRKVKYNVVAEVEKENDRQGSKTDVLRQKVEGALPQSMVLMLKMDAEDIQPVPVEVQLEIEVIGTQVKLYLSSVQYHIDVMKYRVDQMNQVRELVKDSLPIV